VWERLGDAFAVEFVPVVDRYQGVLPGQHRRHRLPGVRAHGVTVRKDRILFGEFSEKRCRVSFVSVKREVTCVQRINAEDKDTGVRHPTTCNINPFVTSSGGISISVIFIFCFQVSLNPALPVLLFCVYS